MFVTACGCGRNSDVHVVCSCFLKREGAKKSNVFRSQPVSSPSYACMSFVYYVISGKLTRHTSTKQDEHFTSDIYIYIICNCILYIVAGLFSCANGVVEVPCDLSVCPMPG